MRLPRKKKKALKRRTNGKGLGRVILKFYGDGNYILLPKWYYKTWVDSYNEDLKSIK